MSPRGRRSSERRAAAPIAAKISRKRDDENWLAHSLIYQSGALGDPSYESHFDKKVDLSLWEAEKAEGVPEEQQKFRPVERVY